MEHGKLKRGAQMLKQNDLIIIYSKYYIIIIIVIIGSVEYIYAWHRAKL